MFRRYRVQKRYPSHFPQKNLALFSPSRHDRYHCARDDVLEQNSLQQRRFGYSCTDGFPTSAYPGSNIETISWNSPTSSDFQSNITFPDASLFDDCSGNLGNVNESPNFSGRTEFTLPPNNLSPLWRDVPLLQNAPLNSMALPMTLKDPFTMHKLVEPLDSHECIMFGPSGFVPLDNMAMWNDGLLSSANDSFIAVDASGTVDASPFMNAIDIVRNFDVAIRQR